MTELSESVERRDRQYTRAMQRRRRVAKAWRGTRHRAVRTFGVWPIPAVSFAAGWMIARRRPAPDSGRIAEEVVERIRADTGLGSQSRRQTTIDVVRSLATSLLIRATASQLLRWWNEATRPHSAAGTPDT